MAALPHRLYFLYDGSPSIDHKHTMDHFISSEANLPINGLLMKADIQLGAQLANTCFDILSTLARKNKADSSLTINSATFKTTDFAPHWLCICLRFLPPHGRK